MSSTQPRRIGVYGGAFDPPHLAHVELARSAVEQYALDSLIIVPTGLAWHKQRSLSPAEHRLAMARLAFVELPQAQVDERETRRPGATYTIDTLREIQSEYAHAQLYLLMGQDQWEFFPSWHRYEEILQIAIVLVASRAESAPAGGQKGLENQGKMPYQAIRMRESPISATQIRALCQQHQAIGHLVNPAVARYIDAHRLYSSLRRLPE